MDATWMAVETVQEQKKNMRVYISGKIGETVVSETTRQKFAKAQATLEAKGYEVCNPTSEEWQRHLLYDYGAEIQQSSRVPPGGPISKYSYFLLRDLMALATMDAIYMLEDWTKSHGARTEHEFAKANGLEILYEKPYDDVPMKLVLEDLIESAENINAGKASLKLINCDGWNIIIAADRHIGK